MIDAGTRVVGVVGNPLGHSLSPFFQNLLLERAGANACYVPLPVAREADLEAAMRGLAAAGLAGVNVTIPYKIAAARLCDSLSEEARAIGAVNVVAFRHGRLHGANTDAAGFVSSLDEAGVALAGREAVVLGAGGAARAVAFALARAGALVTVAARSRDRGLELASAVEAATDGALDAVAWEARGRVLSRAEIVVQATPVGQAPAVESCPVEPGARFRPGAIACDLVYRPLRTRFLRAAADSGARAIDGLGMLVGQGVETLEILLGVRVSVELAREAREACRALLLREESR